MSFDAKRLESFDLLRLGLFVCNKEGDILYANTAAQFLSGQSLKHLKERKLQFYLNSSDEWLANYRAHPEPSFLVPNELDHFLRPRQNRFRFWSPFTFPVTKIFSWLRLCRR